MGYVASLPPLGSGGQGNKIGGKRNETLFNTGVGRFREPRSHGQPAGSHAKTPRNRLQTLCGDSLAMAKGQQNGSRGGQLSASSRYRTPGQSSVRHGRHGAAAKRIPGRYRGPVRQLPAASRRGSSFGRNRHKTNAL